jgi:hypothetical protein
MQKTGNQVLDSFYIKCMLTLACIAVLLSAVCAPRFLYALAGLAAGIAAGMLRTVAFSKLIRAAVSRRLAEKHGPGVFILPYVAILAVLAALVVIAICIDIWAFIGFIAGISLALVVTVIRGLTAFRKEGRA